MDWQPSSKHLVLERRVYEDLKSDLEKIKLSVTAQEARGLAGSILDKLKAKFEAKDGKEDKVRAAIHQMDATLGISHQHEGVEVDVRGPAPGFLNRGR